MSGLRVGSGPDKCVSGLRMRDNSGVSSHGPLDSLGANESRGPWASMEQMEQFLQVPHPQKAEGHLCNTRRSEEIFRGKGGRKGVQLQGLNVLFNTAVFPM